MLTSFSSDIDFSVRCEIGPILNDKTLSCYKRHKQIGKKEMIIIKRNKEVQQEGNF